MPYQNLFKQSLILSLLLSCGQNSYEAQPINKNKQPDTDQKIDIKKPDGELDKNTNTDPQNSGNNNNGNNNQNPGGVSQETFQFSSYANRYLLSNELESLLNKWSDEGNSYVSYETYAAGTSASFPYLRAKFQGEAQNLPKVLITASTHGDEQISTAALLGAIERLMDGVTVPINNLHPLYNRDVFFAPAICYEGFKNQSRNIGNIDPNRNYPSPVTPQRDSVGCTKATMDFFSEHKFDAILDIHAFGRMVLLPWAYSDAPLQGQKSLIFSSVAKAMAEQKNYSWGQVPQLLYVAEGSSMDYYVWQGELQQNDVLALALEISNNKKPPESSIPAAVEELYPLITKFLELAPEALKNQGFSSSLFLSQNSYELTHEKYYISDFSTFPSEE